MKTQRNILLAFILNLAFSIFEFVGGIVTGSVAIFSDAVHDVADAASIGIAYFMEKKRRRQSDAVYTYGYGRYSLLGSVITTLILLLGSTAVIYNAAHRLIMPTQIDYNGMIVFAVVGVCVNLCAALFTREGGSLNQRAVNLHMMEDVLGWAVVLLGAIVMRFTDFTILDPLLSMAVAGFILVRALRNLCASLEPFLEKAPHGMDTEALRDHLMAIEGVLDVHHIHIWSMDGQHHYATMHVVARGETHAIKETIRAELRRHGVGHATLELEKENEHCHEQACHVEFPQTAGHHHHHHHH